MSSQGMTREAITDVGVGVRSSRLGPGEDQTVPTCVTFRKRPHEGRRRQADRTRSRDARLRDSSRSRETERK